MAMPLDPKKTNRAKVVMRRQRGRPVDGILIVDKPQGMSSNEVVQRAKRAFNARKVGHTGSLDPLATGVLPLCFGEATKFSQYLLDSNKEYWTRIRLGVTTETGDSDGRVIAEGSLAGVTRERIEDALQEFRGAIEQVPSMYSALKHKGQPLYKLARQGIEVERKARTVTVHFNELVKYEGDSIELELRCSKGTYVRSIAEDLGKALGCGGHVIALRRRAAGPYLERAAIALSDLDGEARPEALDRLLLPVSSAVEHWSGVDVSEAAADRLRQGQMVELAEPQQGGWVRIFETAEEPHFLGVGEVLPNGRLAPRRLVVSKG
tara:strand:+ start:5254 stop:6216 length:963 start_codon:yes stop_codon:yes gene_type:complete